MTLSAQDRIRSVELAIRLMMEELGDLGIGTFLADVEDEKYAGVYGTAWHDLELAGLVRPRRSAKKTWYQLTGRGWLRGLELTNALEGAREKTGRVMRECKRHVEDRQDTALVPSWEIAVAADVSNSFIENVVKSDFIRSVFNRHSFTAEPRYGIGFAGYLFKIPINFGQEIL